MPGHSSLPCADGVNLSAMPGIHVLRSDWKTWMAGTTPGHDGKRIEFYYSKNQTGCRIGAPAFVLGELKKLLEDFSYVQDFTLPVV
jgi:hypothetical protein